jgi:hypothetical protein
MPMEINLFGLTAAVTAFLSVWIGHVLVRKVEAVTVHLWKPRLTAVTLGLALEGVSLAISSRPLSAVCGILGITLLWDALEIKRQAYRVRKGHAPVNPDNPRHVAVLVEPGSQATTLALLDRDPAGRAVNQEEAIQLIANHRV